MENKYQILNTLSDDEAIVENKPTKLNTKKFKNHFFCARVELTCNSSSFSNTGCTSAASSTLSCVPCENANTISKKSQIPPGEPDQLSQLEIEQEAWFLQTLEEYYVKLNLSEFTPQMCRMNSIRIIGGIRSPRDKQRIFPVKKSIRVTRA